MLVGIRRCPSVSRGGRTWLGPSSVFAFSDHRHSRGVATRTRWRLVAPRPLISSSNVWSRITVAVGGSDGRTSLCNYYSEGARNHASVAKHLDASRGSVDDVRVC